MIPHTWFKDAEQRIAKYIRETPLKYDPSLDIYLKCENHQVTGSFKIRGALNKVLTLQEWELERGLVAASAGNHGQGVAFAGRLVNAPVTIFVSEHAIPAKVQAMREMGANVELVAGGYGDAEIAGLDFAADQKAVWISPYNDGQIIAGQGTLSLEIQRQLPGSIESTWVIPIGGGGLISGVSAALEADYHGREAKLTRRIIGVQSEASPFFHHIFYHGSQEGVTELPSLADGLSGPLETKSMTIPIVKKFVDEVILVSEDQIAESIYHAWENYGERIEGSAAATLAAILSGKIVARPLIVILSGGNIQPEIHLEITRREAIIEK